jgi:hypothetical protein
LAVLHPGSSHCSHPLLSPTHLPCLVEFFVRMKWSIYSIHNPKSPLHPLSTSFCNAPVVCRLNITSLQDGLGYLS